MLTGKASPIQTTLDANGIATGNNIMKVYGQNVVQNNLVAPPLEFLGPQVQLTFLNSPISVMNTVLICGGVILTFVAFNMWYLRSLAGKQGGEVVDHHNLQPEPITRWIRQSVARLTFRR